MEIAKEKTLLTMETAAWGRKVKMVSLVFIYEH
jgi:hypothetical protein